MAVTAYMHGHGVCVRVCVCVCCTAWLAWLGSECRVLGKAMRIPGKDDAGASACGARQCGSAIGLAAS
jgi:hypothetical protein